MNSFVLADLNVKGELQFKETYLYDDLLQIPGAADLIGYFSGQLWRSPEEFEGALPMLGATTAGAGAEPPMHFRWRSSAQTAGMATLRCRGQLASLTLVACGVDENADTITLRAFQQHLLTELRDTGYEPAFALMDLTERPLAATINFESPADRGEQLIAALADRCFAASYFRYHQLA